MSWFDRSRVVAALALSLGLAGCFQPLYSQTAHPGLVEALRAIEVAPIPERIAAAGVELRMTREEAQRGA